MRRLYTNFNHFKGSLEELLPTLVELAKIDHLVDKFEIYKTLMGVSSKAPRDFEDHTECRLGRWYYQGEGRDCFS